jgi:hypothetical protein
MQAGSNTSTVVLRVVGGDEKEPGAWGYNWAILFLGDTNTGTGRSRLGESRIWHNKIWSWFALDSDPRMTALTRPSSNCKRQTRALVREGAPHKETRSYLTDNKNLVLGLKWVLDTRQTGQLTVDRNITLTFWVVESAETRSYEKWLAGIVQESRGRWTSAVRSRYQATASEGWEDFMCALFTVIFGVRNSVRLS